LGPLVQTGCLLLQQSSDPVSRDLRPCLVVTASSEVEG